MRGKRTVPTAKRLAQMLAVDCGLNSTLEEFMINHVWQSASLAAKRAVNGCSQCGKWAKLEVNHRTAVLGRQAEDGCHQHQSNLEALCRSCHRKATRQQFRNGEIGYGRRNKDANGSNR